MLHEGLRVVCSQENKVRRAQISAKLRRLCLKKGSYLVESFDAVLLGHLEVGQNEIDWFVVLQRLREDLLHLVYKVLAVVAVRCLVGKAQFADLILYNFKVYGLVFCHHDTRYFVEVRRCID